jgi:hypothetical protein
LRKASLIKRNLFPSFRHLELSIKASPFHCSQVYIQIENENDNVPLTEQPVYYPSVSENSPAGTKIIQLAATDDDKDPEQKISYRLMKGNPEGFFAINTTTGT